jgi:hypothetical protein
MSTNPASKPLIEGGDPTITSTSTINTKPTNPNTHTADPAPPDKPAS